METIRHLLDTGATAINWWLVISGVVNVLLRLKPLEAWVAQAEKTRAGAVLIGVVRSLGLDPVVTAQVIVTALNARAVGAGLGALFAAPQPPQLPQPSAGGEGGSGEGGAL